MKIKAVEKICKAEHLITLIGAEAGKQWIGATGAIYPLCGFPQMDEDSVFAWMDIPEAKRKNFVFDHVEALYEDYDFEDAVEGERIIERSRYTFSVPSHTMEPLAVNEGVIYVDVAYLKPFGDSAMLYERRGRSGRLYIAVKEGLLLKGIILPMVVERKFTDDLLEIARLTRFAKNYITEE